MKRFDTEFIQYTDKKAKNETKNLFWYLISRSFLYVAILFFAIFFIWYVVFISTHDFYKVSGVSMMPTLNEQIEEREGTHSASTSEYDGVYVEKYAKVELFDVVVIKKTSANGKKKNVIKRVMAMGGDWISIFKEENEEGELQYYFHRIENGTLVDSTYTNQQARLEEENGQNGYCIYSAQEWTEKYASVDQSGFSYEKRFFDNFLSSYDPQDDNFCLVQGAIYVRVPEGKFFYMGDNRANSDDARKDGFLEVKNIAGPAEFVVYDFNFGNRLWGVVKFYFNEMQKFFAR